jgi:flagellar protein FliS
MMMMNNNAAMAYKNNAIATASPGDLTLLLYEGAIKFCNIALMALEKKDYDKAHTNIVKAQNIIIEFRATLNFDYPVAKDFDVAYDCIYERLLQANIRKDSVLLEEALTFIRQMRDTWKEVLKRTKASAS